jgi:poly-gamma-glutamate synthesis protein (capsule biosynthesis protein)
MRNPRLPVRRRQAVPRRDPRYAPRAWWRPDAQTTALGLIVLLLLVGTPLLVIGALGPAGATPTPPGLAGGSPGSPAPSGSQPPGSTGAPPSPATPAPTATPLARVALVPVVGFWSPTRSISLDELKKALAGTSERFKRVIVPTADRDALSAELAVTIPVSIRSGDAAAIREAVRGGALGVMRASDVTAALRALSIGDRHLFGTRRLASIDQWPLALDVPGGAPSFDPAKAFTIVAAGDILLDRGVYRQVEVLGKGVDFPYDGGKAEITGSRCCSGFGYRTPTWRRTGDKGAMRRLLTTADLALANLESPVDDGFRYHTSGTTFSGDPKLLDGVKKAGFDFVSLGNNHIGDAGRDGVLETIAALDERGIAHSGAGTGPAGAAMPAILETHGLKIAVIGCDAVARTYWVADRPDSVGSRPCATKAVADDVAELKSSKQADLVIVFPHWGAEYRARPSATQRDQAKRWIAAGADMIIGNHAHWAAAVEEIDGRLAFYALGNFVFDQMWSAQTMEGLVVELTFEGTTLRQAWLHPTLVIDQSQPNFLEPAGDGAIVIKQVRDASKGLFPH